MPKAVLLSTAAVAARLNISVRRVQALIQSGRLPAEQIGRAYVVRESDLAHVAERLTGRPHKVPTERMVIVACFWSPEDNLNDRRVKVLMPAADLKRYLGMYRKGACNISEEAALTYPRAPRNAKVEATLARRAGWMAGDSA